MKSSIRSFLARIVSRNSLSASEADDAQANNHHHNDENDDDAATSATDKQQRSFDGMNNESGDAPLNDSSYYQTVQSMMTTTDGSSGDRRHIVPLHELFQAQVTSSRENEIEEELLQQHEPSAANKSFEVKWLSETAMDCNENYLEEDRNNSSSQDSSFARRNKFVPKSILKSMTRKRRIGAEKYSRRRRRVVNKQLWAAAGFAWKDKPTPKEEQFMRYMCDMLAEEKRIRVGMKKEGTVEDGEADGEDETTIEEIPDDTPITPPKRVYDLETYAIVQRPPSVLDLTIYDDDEDEYGVFYDQRFIATNYLMEGSPCGFGATDAPIGLRLVRKPLLKNVRTATIVDSYELPPVSWKSEDTFNGQYLGDEVEAEKYRVRQKSSVERSNRRKDGKSNSLGDFKSSTWRLTIVEDAEGCDQVVKVTEEEAIVPVARKAMTSDEIQKMFGLSDAGSIILNVDHIDVVQGQCGFNRGKATKRFMVPLAEEATVKRNRMLDIRRKWRSLFDSYSFAIGNFFGENGGREGSGRFSGKGTGINGNF